MRPTPGKANIVQPQFLGHREWVAYGVHAPVSLARERLDEAVPCVGGVGRGLGVGGLGRAIGGSDWRRGVVVACLEADDSEAREHRWLEINSAA